MKTTKKNPRPFPVREYDALRVLGGAGSAAGKMSGGKPAEPGGATAADIQSATGLPAGGRHAARALERLRAFGHVRRKAIPREGVGRREYEYTLTKKGKKRLEWMKGQNGASRGSTSS